MNKFRRFLGRISSKICLKMDYFGSKFTKIAKRRGLRPQTPLPPAAGGFDSRSPFRIIDWRLRKTLFPLKLLVDADD